VDLGSAWLLLTILSGTRSGFLPAFAAGVSIFILLGATATRRLPSLPILPSPAAMPPPIHGRCKHGGKLICIFRRLARSVSYRDSEARKKGVPAMDQIVNRPKAETPGGIEAALGLDTKYGRQRGRRGFY